MFRMGWWRNQDECDVAQFMLDPGNNELQAKCEAFISLAENRFTSFEDLSPSAFSKKAGKAMGEIRAAIVEMGAWKALSEGQQRNLWSRVQSNVSNAAWGKWRCPELREKDMEFTTMGENVFPTITPRSLGVSQLVLMNPRFSGVVSELKKLNQFQTPAEIIQVFINCKDAIDSLPSSPL